MARSTFQLHCKHPQSANKAIERILAAHGYSRISENGETVWKNGVGFLTAMKYVRAEFISADTLLLSGWIRPLGGSDQDLNGFVAAVPKRQVLKVIEEIKSAIY